MLCELCGKESSKTYRVSFEGDIILVCSECAKKHGLKKIGDLSKEGRKVHKHEMSLIDEMMLIEDYHKIIKEARERRGLSQEELAKILGERVSTIKKIETGKLIPTNKLLKELERVLKIKLTEEKM